MAARQRMTTYRTNGSAAYAPVYEGNVVRNPRRQEEQYTVPKRAPKRRPVERPQVEVRQAGHVAPFAVVGFLAVGVFAALLLLSYLQLHMVSDSVVSLKGQLGELQTQHAALSARYEQVFDMENLEAAVGATMIRPTADQITYIDMSQPDSVVVHARASAVEGAMGAVRGAQEVFSGLVEYFR